MRASDSSGESHGTGASRRGLVDRASSRGIGLSSLAIAMNLVLGACATKPLVPYSTDTPPLALVPASQAGVQDKRARFREVYCAVLEARAHEVPDYRPC